MSRQAVSLDVVIDVVCPWCFIGKRRLDQAIDLLEDDLDISVTYRPFQLDASLPPEGIPRRKYMLDKFGDPGRVAEVHARIEAVGTELGIPFAFERIETAPNTIDAHRIVRWAQAEGLGDEAVERLFSLYFLEGADLTSRDVLVAAAVEIGLDRDEVDVKFDEGTDVESIRAEIAYASSLGITGVPCTIIAGRYAVSGAQTPDVLSDAIRQVMAEIDRAEGGGDA
ncbi:DsbA family oxidoreductase [Chthonobacter rhizosphaerae]|uniref:DsbA family oxidoreductase n=1 Tax=Chthonobacter rhizosphaerae TaxID=2735553 RepID=UPI0015EEA4D8|nr:DsbA family oxidoreductase [Chthonobacter rhizosphaerae]